MERLQLVSADVKLKNVIKKKSSYIKSKFVLPYFSNIRQSRFEKERSKLAEEQNVRLIDEGDKDISGDWDH